MLISSWLDSSHSNRDKDFFSSSSGDEDEDPCHQILIQFPILWIHPEEIRPVMILNRFWLKGFLILSVTPGDLAED